MPSKDELIDSLNMTEGQALMHVRDILLSEKEKVENDLRKDRLRLLFYTVVGRDRYDVPEDMLTLEADIKTSEEQRQSLKKEIAQVRAKLEALSG